MERSEDERAGWLRPLATLLTALAAVVLACWASDLAAQEKPAVEHANAAKTVAKAKPKPRKVHPGDRILGEWWTEDREGRIRFKRVKDGTYRGITTCCKKDPPTEDEPGIDINNPNPKLRNRSTIGIILIWDLKYDGDGEYVDGHVYNPRDGDSYHFIAEIIDDETLEIRGYLGIPLLGQTQIWKRAHLPRKRKAASEKPAEKSALASASSSNN